MALDSSQKLARSDDVTGRAAPSDDVTRRARRSVSTVPRPSPPTTPPPPPPILSLPILPLPYMPCNFLCYLSKLGAIVVTQATGALQAPPSFLLPPPLCFSKLGATVATLATGAPQAPPSLPPFLPWAPPSSPLFSPVPPLAPTLPRPPFCVSTAGIAAPPPNALARNPQTASPALRNQIPPSLPSRRR